MFRNEYLMNVQFKNGYIWSFPNIVGMLLLNVLKLIVTFQNVWWTSNSKVSEQMSVSWKNFVNDFERSSPEH